MIPAATSASTAASSSGSVSWPPQRARNASQAPAKHFFFSHISCPNFSKNLSRHTYCRDLPQMQRLTDRTVFSPDLLREQLAQARINGFAIDDGEIEPGLICVGAPIFGLDQTVVAAVSIAGPTFRMKEELDVMTRAVKATAANISRLMGGRP